MKKTKRAPLSFNSDKALPPAIIADDETCFQENAQTDKRANAQTKISRTGRHFIAAHVMPEAAKQFKMLALQKDATTQDLLTEAINDLFAKYKLSRIA